MLHAIPMPSRSNYLAYSRGWLEHASRIGRAIIIALNTIFNSCDVTSRSRCLALIRAVVVKTHFAMRPSVRSRSRAFDPAAPCGWKKEGRSGKKREANAHTNALEANALSDLGLLVRTSKNREYPSSRASERARKIRVSRFRPDNVRARPRQLMAFDFWLTSHRSAFTCCTLCFTVIGTGTYDSS